MKSTRKINTLLLMMASLSLPFLLTSCNKDEPGEGEATINAYLTDAPGLYNHVFVDIQGVEMHVEGDGWVTVPISYAGVYDLLEFTAGLDTLMGTVVVSDTRLTQVRLILGPNNSIEDTLGVTHELTVPSGQTSGLKVNVQEELEAGLVYDIILDFDAAASIHLTGSGMYMLKPVIRAYTETNSGAISGDITPIGAASAVYAIMGADTVTATINTSTGAYLIGGLEPGTYDVVFVPTAGYSSTTQAGVNVTIGLVTDIGTTTIP